MTKNELQTLAKNCLKNHLHEPGSILYSSHETLKPGDIYLLGFNPGGGGNSPLSNSIERMLDNKKIHT